MTELAPDETSIGWLEKALDDASPEELAKRGLADDAVRDEVRRHVRALGVFGSILALAEPAPADAAIAREAPEALARAYSAVVTDGTTGVLELARAYASMESHGPELARKVLGRTIHELYELEQHGLTADDALRALALVARGRPTSDARDLARAVAPLSRLSARTVLGHLEGQIELVHRLATEELVPAELDRPLLEFAPRVFARRIPSILKQLLPREPKLRLAFVLWGRLRGVAVGRDALVRALDALVPERPITLCAALAAPAARDHLRALAAACAAAPEARALEDIARGDP